MTSTDVYHGSCHCGDIKFQMRLSFPPNKSLDRSEKAVRIYKCNCSTCHKMNMFHCHPKDYVEDFILTSPADISELGEYTVYSRRIKWNFCKKCGVRPFAIGAEWVQEELDVDKWAGREVDGKAKVQKVWRTKPLMHLKGRDGGPLHYVSVNAVTLEGVDLIDWHDKGWILYLDHNSDEDGVSTRFREPFKPGCY